MITTIERSPVASPVGWSSIFAAGAVTIGAWLVLHLVGIGIGLIAIDPENAGSLRGVGIGAGVWSLIAPVIALFLGGLVVGRVAPTINTLNAAIHGGVVWAIAMVAALSLVTMTIGAVVRGAAATGQAAGAIAGAAAGAVGAGAAAADGGTLSALGLSGQTLIEPINRRLQEQGLPRVSADSVEAAAREALATAIQRGDIDRDTIIEIVARRTALTRTDAEQLADQLETRLREARARGYEALQGAQRTALRAAEATGTAVLALSIMLLVGLGAAVGGSILSVRRERRTHVVLPRAATTR